MTRILEEVKKWMGKFGRTFVVSSESAYHTEKLLWQIAAGDD